MGFVFGLFVCVVGVAVSVGGGYLAAELVRVRSSFRWPGRRGVFAGRGALHDICVHCGSMDCWGGCFEAEVVRRRDLSGLAVSDDERQRRLNRSVEDSLGRWGKRA